MFKIIMVKIITLKVSKGGVGKTMIASNLAYVLSQKKFRVLMIDLDSQSNLSKSFIREFDEDKLTSSNLLGDESVDIQEMIYSVGEKLDLISSDIGLHEVAKYLEQKGDYFSKLSKLVEDDVFENYDFVILDLPPGVSDIITELSIASSDLIVCPTHFDIDSLTGIVHTINDISRLSEANLAKDELKYLIVPNRYDKRFKKDNGTIINMLYENLDEEFISEPIRENSHIKKARMIGVSAIEYEQAPERKYEHRRACEDFEALAVRVLEMLDEDT